MFGPRFNFQIFHEMYWNTSYVRPVGNHRQGESRVRQNVDDREKILNSNGIRQTRNMSQCKERNVAQLECMKDLESTS